MRTHPGDKFGNLLRLLAKLDVITEELATGLYNGGYSKYDY